MKQKIEISHRTIIFIFLFMGLVWLLFQIRTLLLLLFLAFILMSILRPAIVWLEKRRVPVKLAILLVFLAMIALVTGFFSLIIPPLAEQTSNLISQLPKIFDQLSQLGDLNLKFSDFSFLGSEVIKLPQRAISIFSSALSNLIYLSTLLVMTFFMLLEREELKGYLSKLFRDNKKEDLAYKTIESIETILGGWARAQVALMVIVGLMTYLGLLLLGIPSAVPLALLAGFLEFVPNLGPTIATVPAAIVGFSVSPVLGIGAIIISWSIQQIENNFLVPKIMRVAVGLRPLITICLLIGGYMLAGVAGTILSIPLYLTARVIVKAVYGWRELK